MSVRIRGKDFLVVKNKLDLRKQGIQWISEIEGLDLLADLRELDLRDNNITRIEGLEKLANLERLDLRDNPVAFWLQYHVGSNAHDNKFLAKWAKDYCVNGGIPKRESTQSQLLCEYCGGVLEFREDTNIMPATSVYFPFHTRCFYLWVYERLKDKSF
jgi:hypothetical protein